MSLLANVVQLHSCFYKKVQPSSREEAPMATLVITMKSLVPCSSLLAIHSKRFMWIADFFFRMDAKTFS